jgi:hypothetical protein
MDAQREEPGANEILRGHAAPKLLRKMERPSSPFLVGDALKKCVRRGLLEMALR